MILGISTATVGTIVGFIFAYALTRTPIPFKNFFRIIATFPIISPPFVVALAAILLFGRSGLLAPDLIQIIGKYSIYGLGGLIIVETIAYSPTAFLTLFGILQAVDPALEEAALNLGANRFQVIWHITLKFLRPAIIGSGAVAFLMSFENFNTTLFLVGSEATLPINLYLQVRDGSTPVINAISFLLIVGTSLLAMANLYFSRKKTI